MSVDPRLAHPVLLALAAKRVQARRQAPDWRTTTGLASLLEAARALPTREPFALPSIEECTGLERLLAEARLKEGERGT
jgi:hypothetical protein